MQVVASKALGVPIVFVEAVDQDGNKVVEKVESEVILLNSLWTARCAALAVCNVT